MRCTKISKLRKGPDFDSRKNIKIRNGPVCDALKNKIQAQSGMRSAEIVKSSESPICDTLI